MSKILIRHGATDANDRVPYILQGQGIDLPLNENGIKQAKKTAEFLSKTHSKIYCSPLLRAKQTAEIIAEKNGAAVEIVDCLVECSIGKWEGLSWDDIKIKYPIDYHWFISDMGYHKYPGGESYYDVLQRILSFLDNVQDAIIVSHGIVCKTYITHKLDIPLWYAKNLHQNNCGINIIKDNDISLNYIGHL